MNITDAGNTLVLTDATHEEKQRILAAIKQPSGRPTMLTRKQVADLIGVHIETIKRYTNAGLLTPVRFTARNLRYSEAEVLEFMKGAK